MGTPSTYMTLPMVLALASESKASDEVNSKNAFANALPWLADSFELYTENGATNKPLADAIAIGPVNTQFDKSTKVTITGDVWVLHKIDTLIDEKTEVTFSATWKPDVKGGGSAAFAFLQRTRDQYNPLFVLSPNADKTGVSMEGVGQEAQRFSRVDDLVILSSRGKGSISLFPNNYEVADGRYNYMLIMVKGGELTIDRLNFTEKKDFIAFEPPSEGTRELPVSRDNVWQYMGLDSTTKKLSFKFARNSQNQAVPLFDQAERISYTSDLGVDFYYDSGMYVGYQKIKPMQIRATSLFRLKAVVKVNPDEPDDPTPPGHIFIGLIPQSLMQYPPRPQFPWGKDSTGQQNFRPAYEFFLLRSRYMYQIGGFDVGWPGSFAETQPKGRKIDWTKPGLVQDLRFKLWENETIRARADPIEFVCFYVFKAQGNRALKMMSFVLEY